ncbi:MAG: hypothetical protein N2050_03655 [Flavobacteriales bacterium]|nr:hypothetical protein [Flavobacteriales bacterium]
MNLKSYPNGSAPHPPKHLKAVILRISSSSACISSGLIMFFCSLGSPAFLLRGQNNPSITTQDILSTSTCSGQFLAVTYSASGSFAPGNQFRAELSNALGQFNNPVVIGSIPFNLGIIPAQVPLTTGLGLYRIRVVSTNPPVIGTPAQQPLLITNIPQATQIFLWPSDSACLGDSIRLSVAPVFSSVQWSNGLSGNPVYVHSTGTYAVKTKDLAGCEGRDTVQVTFHACPTVHLPHIPSDSGGWLFPNPARQQVQVQPPSASAGRLELRAVSGAWVLRQAGGPEAFTLHLAHLPPGVYTALWYPASGAPPLHTRLILASAPPGP